MNQFDIPIVLIFFKRIDKTLKILDQIAKIEPKKLYLISDGPRNVDEKELVYECRNKVESRVNWPCQLVKNYSDVNKGVYDRIAKGALWVFSQEEAAIFLEDDNLPELSFFWFCKEMLELYKDDTRVLWICGTNYLKQYEPIDGSSYMFSRHLMPCGWASWSNKFTRFYDGNLILWNDIATRQKIRYAYNDRKLLNQYYALWDAESKRISQLTRPLSWDYQMSFTLRAHGLYGIVPKYNQIRNIGVDQHSIHGGHSLSNVMTRRFCELETKQLPFPLVHPKIVMCDPNFEDKTGKVILYPLRMRIIVKSTTIIRKMFNLNSDFSFRRFLKKLISLEK